MISRYFLQNSQYKVCLILLKSEYKIKIEMIQYMKLIDKNYFDMKYINKQQRDSMESQKIQKTEGRLFYKKNYPTSSVLTPNMKSHSDILTSKPIRFRKTDHTDEINSQLTNSQIQRQNHEKYVEDGGRIAYTSKVKGQRSESESLIQIIYQKEQRVVELREKLKNIHHFYRIRIEEERKKNLQRSQIFLGIMEELQQIHTQKINNYYREISETETERQEIGIVDGRVEEVKKKIQQVCFQSQQLKASNEQLASQIEQKRTKMNEKQNYYMQLKIQLDEMRDKVEGFEKHKIKQNRGRKELIQLIDHIF